MQKLMSGMGMGASNEQPSQMDRTTDAVRNNPTINRLRTTLGLQPKTQLEELQESMCPKLTFEQRMWGFGICFAAGTLLSLSSMFSFAKLVMGFPTDFAVKYTFGNLLAICSTGFLIGPARQAKQMMAASRWIAVLIYLGAMIMTLISAFRIKIGLITIFFILVQFGAMVWYALSYIPFGRQMLSKCIGSAVGM